jgi:hypothetical protein
MKELIEFKNLHKGEDIYVIASGKSVDFIDNSFFENKITIGINQVYKRLKTNYLVRKEYQLIDEIIKNTNNTIHFISYHACGNYNNNFDNFNFVNKNFPDNLNIVLYNHNNNNINIDKLPENNKLIVSHSTITTGIHLAAYMGAKNIIIVGHDCGTLDGEPNFNGYHNNKTYKIAWKNGKKDYVNWLKKIEGHTVKLKGLLKKKYGCNVYSLNPFVNFGLEGHIYKK